MLNILCTVDELIFPKKVDINIPFPKSSSKVYQETDNLQLTFENNTVLLKVPILSGILYNYIKNYKDYYYFSDKDIALHKSVAAYMNKSNKKGNRRNMLHKKAGIFYSITASDKK